jgi:hypothetical protein
LTIICLRSAASKLSIEALLINTIITEIHSFISRIIGEDIELTTKSCKRKLPVIADRGQIEQVLINLATNARDAMSEGGRFSISAGHKMINGKSKELLGIDSPGEYAVITVRTRDGMKENPQKYSAIFTTKGCRNRSRCNQLWDHQQHNGAITVESTGRRGRFYHLSPLIQMDVEVELPGHIPATTGTETISAEDDEIVNHCCRESSASRVHCHMPPMKMHSPGSGA